MSYILIIGCVQAFFLGLLIFTQNKGFFPNKILMVWMFVLSINLFGGFYAYSGFFKNQPQLFSYYPTLVLLHGPFAFLYVLFYINKIKSIRLKDTIHFIPYLFYTFYFIYKTKNSNYDAIKEIIYNPDTVILSLQINIHVLLIIYSVLIQLKLKKQKKQITESYSFTAGIDLQWVKNMINILIIIVIVIVFGTISSDLFSFISPELKSYFFYACLAIVPFYILYQVIHYNIFQINFTSNTNENKYSGSNLSKEEADLILKELNQLMINDKPYLDSYLSITKLANMLDTHPKSLSQVINEHKQTSFFNFINKHRIEEVINRMNNNTYKHFTLLGIALDSGFNTKSAFNKSFKKFTNLTPSEFQKKPK